MFTSGEDAPSFPSATVPVSKPLPHSANPTIAFEAPLAQRHRSRLCTALIGCRLWSPPGAFPSSIPESFGTLRNKILQK